jgi:AcrR family transcriptional regulator
MNTYPKLRPGPGLSKEAVAAHQRARLHAAMAELVMERDYDAVTVTELVRRARISPRDFYRHYDSKEACFLAISMQAAVCLAQAVKHAEDGAPDWRSGLERAFLIFAGAIATRPGLARLALVEAFAAGPAALCCMSSTLGLFEHLLERSFASGPQPVDPPPPLPVGIVSGVARVARARLIAGREQELPRLAPLLLDWALCFYCENAVVLRDLPPVGGRSRVAPPSWTREDASALASRDERTKILEACAHLVTAEGYGRLSAPSIRAAAGVTRSCFDTHFEDHRDCLLATVEAMSAAAIKRAIAAGAQAGCWPGAVHRAIAAFCAELACDRALSGLLFIEVFSPGPEGACCRERVIGNIAVRLRRSAPAQLRPGRLAAEASVGAVWGAMHERVVSASGHTLPDIAPMLSFLVLSPAIGAKAAIEAIVIEHARLCGLR